MAGGVISRSGVKFLVNSSSRLEIKIAHQSSAATAANTKYQNDLTAIKEVRQSIWKQENYQLSPLYNQAGTWKTERVITSTQNTSVSVLGSKGPILNFCANNYLGLSSHPDVVQAAIDALKSHGAGVSSVRYTVENEVKHNFGFRFICGTQDIHKELEDKISQFHGREHSILYPSCFDANAGLFEQICGPEVK